MSHHAEGAGELIPCPFCGRSDLEIRTDPIVGFPAVNCLECGAVGPNSRSHEKREAAANWNRKATSSAARGSVPCPCTSRAGPPSCEWCGGLGWLTERVRWAHWREMERSERKSVRVARKLDERVRATLACWSEEEREAARELLATASTREEGEGERRAKVASDQAQRFLAEVREATAQASPPGAPPPSFRDRVHDACEEIERKLTGDASEERGQRIAAAGPIVIAFPFEGDIGPDPVPLHDRSWLLGIDRQIGTVKLVDGEAHCTFTDFEFGGAMHRLALASARSPALIVVVKRIDDRVVLVTKSAKSRIIDANQERSR